jgi:iron(II)-dependent oxidoreductase
VPLPNISPLPLGGVDALDHDTIRALLLETRERTLTLVEPVSEHDMNRVHSSLMSPLVWDLGHIAAFEDLWLSHVAAGLDPLRPELMDVYDATETPRASRGDIPYLRLCDAYEYLAAVRRRTLEVLERTDLSDAGGLLNGHGLVWDMIVRHEQQHNETMLQALKLAAPGVYSPSPTSLPQRPPFFAAGRKALVPAGPFELGAHSGGFFAYDNERPRHVVDLPAYEIDVAPVTNGAYRAFIEDGGYAKREWWSDVGWAWRTAAGVERPGYWTADGEVRWFDRIEAIDPAAPVMHVSWYEAEAYARSRGERLPTEAEWEKAANFNAATGLTQKFPWGEQPIGPLHANVGQTSFRAASPGAYPAGASPAGCVAMIGDVWEWTGSWFSAYDGFTPFPYEQYSQVFFGSEYRVLRGGSWATRRRVATSTFRNWDYPIRRQLFSGFRCARDFG